ncbi:hypothetical protein D3C83_01240 [compost metagenome]
MGIGGGERQAQTGVCQCAPAVYLCRMVEADVVAMEIEIRAQNVLAPGIQRQLRQAVVRRRDQRQRVGLQRLPALDQGGDAIIAGATPRSVATDHAFARQQYLRSCGNLGG